MIEEQADKRRDSSFWRELPILLGVAILVALLVRAFLLQTSDRFTALLHSLLQTFPGPQIVDRNRGLNGEDAQQLSLLLLKRMGDLNILETNDPDQSFLYHERHGQE